MNLQNITLHEENIVQVCVVFVVGTAVRFKDFSQYIKDVAIDLIGSDIGMVNSPYLATSSNKCVHTETCTIVVNLSEKPSMGEKVPDAGFPGVP
jgi:hypothetical protein